MTELRTPGLGARGSGLEEPTDAALDREIEQALSVEPSPEFVAHVRARVAGQGAPRSGYGLGWLVLLAGGGAVAAAVLVAAYVGLNPSRETSPTGSPVAVAGSTSSQLNVQPGRAPAQTDAPTVASRDNTARLPDGREPQPAAKGAPEGRTGVQGSRAELDRFPEVMVSASELAGLRQLITMSRAGIQIVETPEAPTATDPEDVIDIVIEPIRITPIELVRLGEAE